MTNIVTSAVPDDVDYSAAVTRRKKKKKDIGVLAFFPPKRRKDVKAIIRALGLIFMRGEKSPG